MFMIIPYTIYCRTNEFCLYMTFSTCRYLMMQIITIWMDLIPRKRIGCVTLLQLIVFLL